MEDRLEDRLDDRPTNHLPERCTAFRGRRLLASGPLEDVALAAKAAIEGGAEDTVLVFDDATGRVVDLDLRGSDAEAARRLSRSRAAAVGPDAPGEGEASARRRGPGRPRLGVVAREVTLLPRHWAWLGAQPAGASAALRRLVDDARRKSTPLQERRAAQEAAYRFMLGIAGDLPGYEEATRALFANDRSRLEERIAAWPEDVRAHVVRLAFPSAEGRQGSAPTTGREEVP